jgi:hypothetical protein
MRARRAEETAHRGRARGRSRSETGLGQKQVGSASEKRLRERAGRRARGDHEVPDKQNAPLAPGRSGRPYGTLPIPGEDPRPPGEPTMRSGRPAAVAECRGRSAGTPFLHGVRITRELRRARN